MDEGITHFDGETYRQQIADRRNRMAEIAMQIDLSGRIALLAEHPGWKDVSSAVERIRDGELRRLSKGRIDLYDLALRQGRLSVLEMLLNLVRPLREDEIGNLRSELARLQSEVSTLEQLL